MKHGENHLTASEKETVRILRRERDRHQAKGNHEKVIIAERGINTVFDNASDRERD